MKKRNFPHSNKEYFEKVQTIESTISTLYITLSAEKNELHDWELFKYLFHPQGKLIEYASNSNGHFQITYMSPIDYIKKIGKYLDEVSFFEKEIKKKIDQFGSMAHVSSWYESYHSKHDKNPYFSGLNSFQLLYQNDRWWIINNFWSREPNNLNVKFENYTGF